MSAKTTKAGHYGDGSYTLRKDGRYIVRYKGQCKYARTEADAIKTLRELRIIVDSGNKPAVHRKLDTYCAEWLKNDRRVAWKPSTYATMEKVYNNHIKPMLGFQLLGKIQPKDIQKLLNDKKAEVKTKVVDGEKVDVGAYSYTTVHHIYVFLAELFFYAFRQGDIPQNPIDKVDKPKRRDFGEQKQIAVLEFDTISKLEEIAALRNGQGNPLHRHGNLIVLMLKTGLRCGEMLGLRWQDVEFDRREIHVVGNWVRYSNPDKSVNEPKIIGTCSTPKTESGKRVVPLNDKAFDALRQYESDWGHSSEYIAVTSKGNHIDHKDFTRVFQRMARDAGIRKEQCESFHLHMLRHTFASVLLSPEIDAPVSAVSKWMGHKHITTTLDTYTKVLQQTESDAIAKLNRI